jgi:hypothetical protein
MSRITVDGSTQLDAARLSFDDEAKPGKRGGLSASLLYEGKELWIQTPPMRAPFGIAATAKPKPGDDPRGAQYNLPLNFGDAGSDEFQRRLKACDERLLDECARHARGWFNRDSLSRDRAAEDLVPSVRWPLDAAKVVKPGYPPSFKPKVFLNAKTGMFDVDVVDSATGELMPVGIHNIDALRGAVVTALVQVPSVWFQPQSKMFGLTVRCKILRVESSAASAPRGLSAFLDAVGPRRPRGIADAVHEVDADRLPPSDGEEEEEAYV